MIIIYIYILYIYYTTIYNLYLYYTLPILYPGKSLVKKMQGTRERESAVTHMTAVKIALVSCLGLHSHWDKS